MRFRDGWMALGVASVLAFSGSVPAEEGPTPRIEVFKSPRCGCCSGWARHLAKQGFQVKVKEVADLDEIKRKNGVPSDSHACHTAIVGKYTIEGHVPASDIQRLLREQPAVRGLVVPGMPLGSPGMEASVPPPYTVYTFDNKGHRSVFSRHE